MVTEDLVIYDLDSYCQFYDPNKKICTVYEQRFKKQSRCQRVTRWRAMFAPYLPPECGYVQWAKKRNLRWAKQRNIRFIHQHRGTTSDEDPELSFV
ncbi:MAG: hypothetical protein ACOX0W_03325 [Sphaerochaetaceae bacterium]